MGQGAAVCTCGCCPAAKAQGVYAHTHSHGSLRSSSVWGVGRGALATGARPVQMAPPPACVPPSRAARAHCAIRRRCCRRPRHRACAAAPAAGVALPVAKGRASCPPWPSPRTEPPWGQAAHMHTRMSARLPGRIRAAAAHWWGMFNRAPRPAVSPDTNRNAGPHGAGSWQAHYETEKEHKKNLRMQARGSKTAQQRGGGMCRLRGRHTHTPCPALITSRAARRV